MQPCITCTAKEFDPYPFILLNLLFSTQAAYAAPLILLSQNRTAERDRIKAEHDFDVNVLSLPTLAELLGDVRDLEAQRRLRTWIDEPPRRRPGRARTNSCGSRLTHLRRDAATGARAHTATVTPGGKITDLVSGYVLQAVKPAVRSLPSFKSTRRPTRHPAGGRRWSG